MSGEVAGSDVLLGPVCYGIKIPSLGLSETFGLEDKLDLFTSLITLDISNNTLRGQIPFYLPPNLQTLNLTRCGLEGPIPYSLLGMTSVTYINLSHNQLRGHVHVDFSSLASLTTLDWSFNNLSGDLPRSFQSLTSLRELYLNDNRFTGSLDVLSDLPLRNLTTSNNFFTASHKKTRLQPDDITIVVIFALVALMCGAYLVAS